MQAKFYCYEFGNREEKGSGRSDILRNYHVAVVTGCFPIPRRALVNAPLLAALIFLL